MSYNSSPPPADISSSNDMEIIQKLEAEMDLLVTNAREQSRRAMENAQADAQQLCEQARIWGEQEGRAAAAAVCQQAEEESRSRMETSQQLAAEQYQRTIRQMGMLVCQAAAFVLGLPSEDFTK